MIGMPSIVGILSNNIVHFIIPDHRTEKSYKIQFYLSLNTPVSRKTKKVLYCLPIQ